jgi:dolichol-phosphate mannosyltransferase
MASNLNVIAQAGQGPDARRDASSSQQAPVLGLSAQAMSLVVVLPTYNEIDNIAFMLDSLLGLGPSIEVLVVDDASPDGTAKVANEVAAEYPGRVHVMNRPHKSGLGVAYRAGFAWALERGYEVIVQMDADRSHPSDQIPVMVDLIGSGRADVVVGSRYVPGGGTLGWPWRRRMLSRFANLYARSLLGLNQRDVTGAFRAWSWAGLAAADPDSTATVGYGFMVEMAAIARDCGLRCAEIPIVFVDRIHGASKMTAGIGLEAMRVVWRLRRSPHPANRTAPRPAGIRPAMT